MKVFAHFNNWKLIATICFVCGCSVPKNTDRQVGQPEQVEELSPQLWVEAIVEESCRLYEDGMAALSWGDRQEGLALLDEAVLLLLEQDDILRSERLIQSHLSFLIETIHDANVNDATDNGAPEEEYDGATLERLLAGSLTEDLIAHIGEHTTAETAAQKSDFPIVHNAAVDRFLFSFTHDKAPVISAALERSSAYVDTIRKEFKEIGIPQDLCFLPMIESGYKTRARSRVRATGMWQFMAGTGRDFGLNVNWWEDQRLDPYFSTIAAGKYLKFLYAAFDDWYLALAAYNAGPGRVRSAIRRGKTRDFWKLARRRLIPRETIGYIPAFLASLKIAKNPEQHGFVDLAYEKPLKFSEVDVDFCIDLEVLSEELGLDPHILAELNPSLLRGITPGSGVAYGLRIPTGTEEQIRTALNGIPPEKRLKIRHYRVKKGDTLSTIAKRHGTSLKALTSLNGIRNPRRLQIGQNLIIPLGPFRGSTPGYISKARRLPSNSVRHRIRRGDTLYALAQRYQTSISSILRKNPDIDPMALRPGQTLTLAQGDSWGRRTSSRSGTSSRYRIQKGDSLSAIASRFRISPQALANHNRLSMTSVLQIGQILEIPDQGQRGPQTTYIVRKGDTLWEIAQRFNTTVNRIAKWNRISSGQKIQPGDVLHIRR